MTTTTTSAIDLLRRACAAVGLPAEQAEPLRIAENHTWSLSEQGIVVRIAREGQAAAAEREVRVARWLAHHRIRAVQPADLPQPVDVDGRPATFWHELPPHTHGSTAQVARTLRELHDLPQPTELGLGRLDPFVRIPERLHHATALDEAARSWLTSLLQDLTAAWAELPPGLPECAIHGDAWPGNVVTTVRGPTVIDLERFSVGPPEWDLVSTAVRAKTTGAVSVPEYETFCDTYGCDVTEWEGYETLAGARELRMATYAAQHASSNPAWAAQARYRLECLQGHHGPRPWTWAGIM